MEVELEVVLVALSVELDVLFDVEFSGILELLSDEEEFEDELEVLLAVEFVTDEFDESGSEPLFTVELKSDEFDRELFELDVELLELLLD